MTDYDNYINKKNTQYGDKFSDENLNPQFIAAYNNRDSFRVLVDLGYEKPVWGYIGVTTGWMPTFLLIRRRGQHGSSDIINQQAKIIESKWLAN